MSRELAMWVVIGCALAMAWALWTKQAPEGEQGITHRLLAVVWTSLAVAAFVAGQ